MNAFTLGMIIAGSVGIPLTCAIVRMQKEKEEKRDGSKDVPHGTEDDEGRV